eukprot:TRINITY_DN5543_c0_g1_i5.p5 TRINITY_DN5543_c0_g1~~TRINITY_DN5543_c0_g1_i5.p5  ORF type:complete len:112 (+),score=44.51 TRINITY_DN5543_c0_g1_i5:88-423(+)
MIRRPPRSTHCISSAASDVYKRQVSTQSTWDFPIAKEIDKSVSNQKGFNRKSQSQSQDHWSQAEESRKEKGKEKQEKKRELCIISLQNFEVSSSKFGNQQECNEHYESIYL